MGRDFQLFPLKGTERLSRWFRVTEPLKSWLQSSRREEAVGGGAGLTLCKSGALRWKQVLTFSDTNLKTE